jgi:shikimate dehydrogenase
LDDLPQEIESAARAAGTITGTTTLAGVIGWPVEQSLSPVIHNAAYAALGLDWVYVPLPVGPDSLLTALAGLRAMGFAGANVTMPHKEEAATASATLSEDAELVGAVNSLVFGAERLEGHNTDVAGFARFLEQDAGFDPAGRSIVVYGAGGAARACIAAVVRGGAVRATVVVRDLKKGEGLLAERLADRAELHVASWNDPPPRGADLFVNATPVHGDLLPLPPLHAGQLVVDLLYRPTVTPLVARARETGASAFTGLGMLLHQAALSFELWTGYVPPLDVMSAAALAELGPAAA